MCFGTFLESSTLTPRSMIHFWTLFMTLFCMNHCWAGSDQVRVNSVWIISVTTESLFQQEVYLENYKIKGWQKKRKFNLRRNLAQEGNIRSKKRSKKSVKHRKIPREGRRGRRGVNTYLIVHQSLPPKSSTGWPTSSDFGVMLCIMYSWTAWLYYYNKFSLSRREQVEVQWPGLKSSYGEPTSPPVKFRHRLAAISNLSYSSFKW